MTSNTAILMIDVQNMYKSTDGMRERLGWPPIWRMAEVVEECRLLLEDARAKGIPVIYSRAVGRRDGADMAPRSVRMGEYSGLAEMPFDEAEYTWKQQIMDEVAPEAGDIVIDKLRPSFFEYTALEPVLMNLGVTRLVVAGLQTNVCVEATTRSALAHNFEVAIPEDAVSTDGPDLHWGALNSMRVLYAEVAPWRELLAPDAMWDRAFTTPNYGRNPAYWVAPTV
jgi:ureidoacrylate peracid hydrolase